MSFSRPAEEALSDRRGVSDRGRCERARAQEAASRRRVVPGDRDRPLQVSGLAEGLRDVVEVVVEEAA